MKNLSQFGIHEVWAAGKTAGWIVVMTVICMTTYALSVCAGKVGIPGKR